jgi:Putative adhesin
MSVPLALAAATVISLGGSADTTIAVSKGTALQIANFAGEVTVKAWDKNAVRVLTDAPGGEHVVIKYEGDMLLVKGYSKRAAQRSIDMNLFVPAWMDLAVSGIHTDVSIDGTKGRVRVETVHGDIAVSGGREKIELNAVNQDIHLMDAVGIVLSETVNGDMILQRIESDSVDVSTVNGEIFYEGSIRNRGVYRFTSHNGDIAVALPKTADAMVNVSTFSGDFASEFPVSLTETKQGRQFCFIMGRGSARVDLESFQGTIHIFRPGSRGPVANMETPEAPKPPKAPKAHKGKREYGGSQETCGSSVSEPGEPTELEDPEEPMEPEELQGYPTAPEPPTPPNGHEDGSDLEEHEHFENVNRN